MPRKLKTYITSLGFFDQAVAAPSMKAALEAWGSNRNLFQRGFAEETNDPAIVAATMAKPGVVLKRAVGSNLRFSEHPALPSLLAASAPKRARKAKVSKKGTRKNKKSAEIVSLTERRAAKEAALAYEKERVRRERENRKEELARQKEQEQREEAVRRADAALETATQRHETTMHEITAERASLDEREEREKARWQKEKQRLKAERE